MRLLIKMEICMYVCVSFPQLNMFYGQFDVVAAAVCCG